MPFTYPSARNRLFEWVMALAMLGCALNLSFPANSLDKSVLRVAEGAGLSEPVIATLFGVFGLLRIAALIVNGKSRVYGPWCRAAAGCVSAIVLSILTGILIVDALAGGVPAFTIPWLGFPVAGEIIVVYRAAADVGRSPGS